MEPLMIELSMWIAKGLMIDIITPRLEDQLGNRVSLVQTRMLNVIGLCTRRVIKGPFCDPKKSKN